MGKSKSGFLTPTTNFAPLIGHESVNAIFEFGFAIIQIKPKCGF